MTSAAEKRLIQMVGEDAANPWRFAHSMYQWGKGELVNSQGPRKWQSDILLDLTRHLQNPQTRFIPYRLAVASGHGIGKAHPCDLIIPTPCGKMRWGDLGIGDVVFGADGFPTEIRAIKHYKNIPVYRVTFDDGSFTDVSSGHLWTVRGRKERRNKLTTWRTMETMEILEQGVKRSNGAALARQWEIPVQGAAHFNVQEIDFHPYAMGVWLGDGCRNNSCIKYAKPYPEIAEKITSFGYELKSSADGTAKYFQNCAHLLEHDVFSRASCERYIPDEYKFNSAENRRLLFEGLCDTDGEAHKCGSIGYSTTSRRLAEDMVWLARSLGGKASIQETPKNGWYYNENKEKVHCRDCYRVTINVPFNPFTLQHRKERYKPSESRYLSRWIESIEPLQNADCMCIEVDARDGLYQTNDFLVTHNSSLIAMIIHWGLSTCVDTKILVTANSEPQLRTKTWPEVNKWFRMSVNNHWFKITATSIAVQDKDHERTWRADALPWTEHNPEAFAGLHNKGRRIIVIFDESSNIAEKIWEVIQGALTDEDTEIIWIAFGNPTRNAGAFRECFGRFKHRWRTKQIDSRSVEGTNKREIQQWLEDYGEDSDFFKVRVKGEFPRAGSMQFIPSDIVEDARRRQPEAKQYDPIILGCDIARFGDDETVLVPRRGRDAQSLPWITLRGADTMQVAAKIMELDQQYKFDAIFVDGGGVGGGVIDRLRMMQYRNVIEVQFGASADKGIVTSDNQIVYANKRAEMYGNMRDWLRGGMIPDDPELIGQLTSVEYGYVMRDGRDAILLEKKSDMKKRGLASPDRADALALTFAYPVMPSDHSANFLSNNVSRHVVDYQPLSTAYLQQQNKSYNNHVIEYSPFKR